MHRWRIGDPDIPSQVASPQSLTPLLRATQPYRFSMLVASKVGHRSYASKIHCRLVWRVVSTLQPDEPQLLIGQVLSRGDVLDPDEAVVALLEPDSPLAQFPRQPFATIHADVNGERQPGL